MGGRSYGLIKWKMDIELGHHPHVDFGNPDFVKLAESYGAKGYAIERAEDLLPTLKRALAGDTVSVIACPVDYSQNLVLTDRLGALTRPSKGREGWRCASSRRAYCILQAVTVGDRRAGFPKEAQEGVGLRYPWTRMSSSGWSFWADGG